MNVCLVASGYPSRARPVHNVFIKEQVGEMVRQGLKVRVITSGEADSPAEDVIDGVVVYRVMQGRFKPGIFYPLIFALKALGKAMQLNRTERFEVVHAHFADHAGLAGAIISRVLARPFVLTVHGYDVNYDKNLGYGLGTRWLQRLYVFLILRSARRVCPVSRALNKQCLTAWRVPRDRLAVIHNGTRLTTPPDREELDRFKDRLDLGGKRVILSISSLVALKGQQCLLKALPPVFAEFPEAVFILVGEGPYFSQLTRIAGEMGLNGNVRIFDRWFPRREIALFLGICEIFCLVSLLESFGIVYVEAMAQSKPVIGSRGQGCEDFIRDGVNGFLVDPGDTPALTARLKCLLRDDKLRERLGQQGRATVEEGYLWSHSVTRLKRLYGSLVKN